MLSEAFLQTLLVIAYLAIGLLAVTLPVYAICITYLRQEMWETVKDRKKRISRLKKTIEKLNKELSGEKKDSERFKEIQRQMKEYKSEMKSERVVHLTVLGAVVMPFAGLATALLLAVVGIYSFYADFQPSVYFGVLGSVLSCSLAVYCLLKTLFAVEHAALRQVRTVDFDVGFYGGKKVLDIKLGEESDLVIGARSEAHVEDFVIYMRIPTELKVTAGTSAVDNVYVSRFPDLTTITGFRRFVPKDIHVGLNLPVIPEKVGEYSIPIHIHGKGVREYRTAVTLRVVK